jgi:hypothetical protein
VSAHRTRRVRTTTGIVTAFVAFPAGAWASDPSLNVTVPQVSVPAVPEVRVPAVAPAPVVQSPVPSTPPATPSLPVGGIAPGAGWAEAPSSGAGGSAAPAPGAAPLGSAAEAVAPGTPAAAWAAGSTFAQAAAGARSEARRRAVYERRLRRTVARLAGCLYGVAPVDRRVLVLRAGPGRARPHSRAAVARRLALPLTRVTRSERRGLRSLRATNRFTGCGAAGEASRGELVASTPPMTLAGAGWSGPLIRAPGGDRARGGRGRPEGEGGVLGARAEGTAPPLAAAPPGLGLPAEEDGGGGEPLVLLAFVAATIATAALVARRVRHGSAPEPAAGAPAFRRWTEPLPGPGKAAEHEGEPDPRDWEPPPAPWSRS